MYDPVTARPITVLTGPLANQGAPHGVLDTRFMLDMPVLRVELVLEGCAEGRLVDW